MEDMQELLVGEFIALTALIAFPGASEFYYWEVLEGLTKPSYIAGPPSDEAMDIFRLMRDDVRIWVMWRDNKWSVVPIEEWRQVASLKTFAKALRGE